MSSMFKGAKKFNKAIKTDGNKWKTTAVTKMSEMFSGGEGTTDFDADITNWDTGAVTTMASMFNGAAAFNKAIKTDGNKWKTTAVTKMSEMFSGGGGTTDFDADITDWDTKAVTDMSEMFNSAAKFNKAIKTDGNKWKTTA